MRAIGVATIAAFICAWSMYSHAQTCIVPAPSAPPRPRSIEVVFNQDGGCTPCTATAYSPASVKPPTVFALGNAKCNQACAIAEQAVANDNGWSDGGTP